jgi:ribosomal protein S13
MGKAFMFKFVIWICLLFSAAFLGCSGNAFEGISDDDSFEARLESARMHIDDGQYREAVSILDNLKEEQPHNDEVTNYLSSAYAGLAGLNTFDLLEVIDDLDESGNSGSIDMVGMVLGDSDGLLTTEGLPDQLDNLTEAIDQLNTIEDPTDDQKVQMGLLSVSRIGLTLANVICNDTGNTSLTLTEDGIQLEYDATPEFEDGDVSDQELEHLSSDIQNVGEAIAVMDEIYSNDNDLNEDFTEFTNDFDQNADGAIDIQELENYIGALLGD